MNAITLTDLDISYGDTQVTHGITLDIAEGESFALVGESGSGKSTVLRAIAGLAPDWEGRISVLGRARKHGIDRQVARQCQMVFQDPYGSLHPRKTIDAALSEPLAIHGLGNRGARVEAMLAAVGLDRRFRFRFPHQLSGGQKARVGIARAIALNPKLVILDEPTAALDVSVQAVVLNLLADLKVELGMSYLFISHDLNVVRLICDRVMVMRQGQIVEEGETETVLKAPASDYTRTLLDAIPHPPEIHQGISLAAEVPA